MLAVRRVVILIVGVSEVVTAATVREVLLTVATVYTRLLSPHYRVFVCLQEMSVGYANGIRVMSMTHTGEPGFMLYIPIEVRPAHICTHKQICI